MASGIYAIGTPSGKIYVGSTTDLQRRRLRHFRDLRNGKHVNTALQRSFVKYGADLTFTVLEECDKEQLHLREQLYLDAIPTVLRLNVAAQAAGGSGAHSDEAKEKIRQAKSGVPLSQAHRDALAEVKRGTRLTATHRERISRSLEHRRTGVKTRANTSGFVGVSRNGKGWLSYVSHKKQYRWLGTHATPDLAYAVRLVYLAALPPGGV